MSKMQKSIYGALMGLGAYLLTALLLTMILLPFMGGRDFFALFAMIAIFGFIIGAVFVLVGTIVAVNKSPREAVRPLIITSVIVLVAVGGCFGLVGIF